MPPAVPAAPLKVTPPAARRSPGVCAHIRLDAEFQVGGRASRRQVTLNFSALVAVPPAVVTSMYPSWAPLGTFTLIDESESDLIFAVTPSMVTEVAPAKFVPVMVTTVPTAPDFGEKLVMVGAGGTTSKHSATAVSELAW